MNRIILCLLAAVLSFPYAANASPLDDKNQQMILFYVNEYRAKHHLPPLRLSRLISKEAVIHSYDMAHKKIPFGHIGYNQRIKRLYNSYPNCNGGAENVAYYKINAKKLVEGWLASPGHRRNIEGHYNLTGIGIAYTNKPGWAYFTQIFLRSEDNPHGYLNQITKSKQDRVYRRV